MLRQWPRLRSDAPAGALRLPTGSMLAAAVWMVPGGFTPLLLSAQYGHEQCARALIEAGARKDLETKKSSTALSLARSKLAQRALCTPRELRNRLVCRAVVGFFPSDTER